MGKAEINHTPERLPLHDDPRWLPLRAAIELRQQQTGSATLAVRDLEQAMASGKLRNKRRSITTDESKFNDAECWQTYFVGFLTPSSVIVCRQTDPDRHKTDEYGNLVAERLGDWLFYVWSPDYDDLWSAKRSSNAQRQGTPGAPPKFTEQQQQWLREKYSSDLKAKPALAAHDAAVPHVQKLAMTEFGIEAGSTTLRDQIIRPVLRAAKKTKTGNK